MTDDEYDEYKTVEDDYETVEDDEYKTVEEEQLPTEEEKKIKYIYGIPTPDPKKFDKVMEFVLDYHKARGKTASIVPTSAIIVTPGQFVMRRAVEVDDEHLVVELDNLVASGIREIVIVGNVPDENIVSHSDHCGLLATLQIKANH